jgi:hypothetical protein
MKILLLTYIFYEKDDEKRKEFEYVVYQLSEKIIDIQYQVVLDQNPLGNKIYAFIIYKK